MITGGPSEPGAGQRKERAWPAYLCRQLPFLPGGWVRPPATRFFRGASQRAVQPPSAYTSEPVMYEAESLANRRSS